jgi:hypothetical protein
VDAVVTQPDQRAGAPLRRCYLEGITMAHAGTMDLGQNVQSKPSGNPWPLIGLAVAAVAIVAAVWFASSAGLVGGQLAAKPADRSYDAIEAQRGTVALSADRGYDAIEAQRAAIASTGVCRATSPTSGFTVNVACAAALTGTSGLLSGKAADDIALGRDNSYDTIEASRGLFAGSTPVCRAISSTTGFTVNVACSTTTTASQAAAATGGWSAAQYNVTRMLYVAPARPTMVDPVIEAKTAMLLAAAKAQHDASRLPYLLTPSTLSSPSGTFHLGNPAIGEQITLLPGWKTIDIPAMRDRVGGP